MGGNKANAVDLIVGRVVSASAEFTRRQLQSLLSCRINPAKAGTIRPTIWRNQKTTISKTGKFL